MILVTPLPISTATATPAIRRLANSLLVWCAGVRGALGGCGRSTSQRLTMA